MPARITADSRYALYVNGREVAHGPVRGQPRRLSFDAVDLAPCLHPGENVIAVYVRYYGVANAFWMPAVPNTTLGRRGVLALEADLGEAGWLLSDESWRARKVDAWDPHWRDYVDHGPGVPLELFDARRFPQGWLEPDFDDRAWGSARPIAATHMGGFARSQPPTDPYGPLDPRSIAFLTGTTKLAARARVQVLEGSVDLTEANPLARLQAVTGLPTRSSEDVASWPIRVVPPEGGAVRLSLDMGAIVSGLVGFELDAPAGTVLDIAYGEEPLRPSLSMDRMRAGSRYIARGSEDRFRLFESTGFRYADLLIHGAVGPTTLHRFDVEERLYPWTGETGFRCSDDELQAIFDAGVRTVEVSSHDAFIDCPTREQRAWVGDAVVHQMVHLATNADWRLARHFVALADSPRPDGILPMSVAGDIEASGGFTIPDWSLHWGHALYNLYRYDGDREEVKGHLPTLERILRWYTPYRSSNGLLEDVPEWNLVDWSSVSTEGTSAVLTALWARGLREFAEMAAWLDERGSQAWAQALFASAREGFEVFWDEARGSYVDHLVGAERRPEMHQLAGALAIVSRLAPEERWQRIADTITDPARLVIRSWVGDGQGHQSWEKWDAQVRLGRYDIDWDVGREIVLAQPFMAYVVHDAVALAGRADRLPDLLRRWSQFLEGGHDTFGECWDFGTHAHGWSATPARDLVFYTLGVTPAEPGYLRARIAPRLGPLAWARGTVPTPHGPIRVYARPDEVVVETPVDATVEIEGAAAVDVRPGRHSFPAPAGASA